MKQVLRKGLKDIVVDELPAPVAGRNQVLVSPVNSLISSGTETASIHKEGILREVAHNPSHLKKVLAVMRDNGPFRTMREVLAKFSDYAVLGYAGAGIVVGKHISVTDLEVGDRVSYGGEGTGHGECIVTGRHLVAPVPEEVGFDSACFATLGAIAMNGIRVAQIGLGETVAVIGLGIVGQLTVQLARAQGARVIALDLKPERVDLARRLGAEAGFAGPQAREAVLAFTSGHGVDCAIVAAASASAAPCQAALQMVRDRGRIVVLGAVEMSFPWLEMYLKEVELRMSRAYGPGSYDPAYERDGHDYPRSYVRWTENRNMEEFLRLLARGDVRVTDLVTHRFPLDRAADAYAEIMNPEGKSVAVLLDYPSGMAVSSPSREMRRVDLAGSAGKTDGLQVALIGAANIARWAHVPALKKAGATLRAIQTGNPARAKAYANRFGAQYCTTDYDQVLKDGDVNAVIIASRNQRHGPEALAALKAGKHVFVEKPMCLTEEEASELLRAAHSTGLQLVVGFNRRFAPDYVRLKDSLRHRTGPVVLNARVSSPGIAGSFWMADPLIGGAILGEACHFLDLFYWLIESEPVTVSAVSLPTDTQEPIGQNNIAASLKFADGSIASLTYCTVGAGAAAGERVEVLAPGMTASTENFKHFVEARRLVRRSRRWFASKGYDVQMKRFVEAIAGGGPAGTTVEDGARATVACLRLMDSCREFGALKQIDWRSLV
jgi:polar amino acid transport system substrate-binding protein